ncbi:MAG: ABC transporter substrate-binding protein [Deltaproteobacteria bacterium]|nr:ABC transporter substrate-binding protein [Deltaproteobacteria bacterium]
MKKMKTEINKIKNIILILLCLVLVSSVYGTEEKIAKDTEYRVITDMAGRRVKIPVKITKVLSTSPPPTTFIYMLAPEKLGGWVGGPSKDAGKLLPKEYHNIPNIGWGRGETNYEAYIAARPDLVFIGVEVELDPSRAETVQEKFGTIPVVCIENSRNATGYAKTITFMGDVLGVPDRAKILNDYYLGVLKEVQERVATIPQEKRTRIYYAEGNNGLSTDPSGSPHSQLIDVCGGFNVAVCSVNTGSGMTEVTMESVLMWRPDVIITTSREFIPQAYKDKTWNMIPAVKKRNIHLTPSKPFNWFDRPPGVNRIVGIPWTAHVLYPDIFTENWFREKAKRFYSIFYHYDLTDEELTLILKD